MAITGPETLHWLLPAEPGFRGRARQLTAGEGPVDGKAVAALAAPALDLDQLTLLARSIDRLGDRLVAGPLDPLRLAILGDGTFDYAAAAIRASGPRHGVLPDIYVPDYGTAAAEAMNPDGRLAAFRPQVVLIAPDPRLLGLDVTRMDPGEAVGAVDAALARIDMLADAAATLGATLLIQTAPLPADPWCGHVDRRTAGSPIAQTTALNDGLVRIAEQRAAVLLDLAALADLVGRARWSDPALWHRTKVPFAIDMIPLYADHVARLLGAIRGKARKCLVLDLDNTCWGGVIGDDGLDGIRLGQGSSDGEAFLAVQRYALALKARGVVLAVVSKNEDDVARLPFREHPEMLLREDDIAVFIADWTDKATNIAHVAKRLNIGTDALAFLDDNPAERARVRQMLPEVAVPELPLDPSGYVAALAQSGLFETIGLSADDTRRAAQYRENAERAVALEKIGDYEEYLLSLEMTCDIREFDAVGRTRIAQLVNKSNQFNLTTRRYTDADIAAMETDPKIFGLQVRLADRFGDNGMISVVIFRTGPETWVCDTWLMSCRVLGRRVEEAVLATVANRARAEGAAQLVGEYLPSAKNRMVAEHFAKLGFARAGEIAGGGTRWQLQLAEYKAPSLPMRIVEAAGAPSRVPGA